MAGWLAGCLSVTRRYCIETTKPILKLFDHLVAPSFLFLLTPALIPNSKGNPFSSGAKYTGVGKLAIFVRFSTEIAIYLGNGAR